jgi:hypothetical protein
MIRAHDRRADGRCPKHDRAVDGDCVDASRQTPIHVFLDNACYDQARLMQEWLARPGCQIKLHFIPSCLPGFARPLVLCYLKSASRLVSSVAISSSVAFRSLTET